MQTIRRWWHEVGQPRYPQAHRLTTTADGGGSNGSRVRLWRELQGLADEIGLDISVHHFPPGTSKWNTIEHRLFSFISLNWRATPLVSYQVIVDLIANTTTRTGLSVRSELDTNSYPKGITRIIPDPGDQDPCAHLRRPRDMMSQGRSMSLFHASQQWSTTSV